MSTYRLPHRILLLLLGGALAAGGCVLIPSRTNCDPPCGDGQTCDPNRGVCVSNTPDLAMPVSMPVDMASIDMSMPDMVQRPDLQMPDLLPPPECVQDADCTGALADLPCIANKCTPCQKHADCALSQVCDVYLSSTRGLGKCVAQYKVVYLDNKNGGMCTSGDGGTPATAACTIADALAKVVGMKEAIRVLPSTATYGALVLPSKAVNVFGPAGEGGTAKLSDPANPALSVTGGSTVIVDGFDIGSGGVSCNSATGTLSLRRSNVNNALATGFGLDIQACTMTMDRCRVAGNVNQGAMRLQAAAVYTLTNNFIVGNNSVAANSTITIANNCTGKFQFNTVGSNVSAAPAGIECGAIARDIEDSIFANNSLVGGTRISGKCTLKTTVVGATDTATGGIQKDPKFKNPAVGVYDYHLIVDALNDACCVDKASMNLAIKTDFDGTVRPLGGGYDIGAHELK